MRTVPALSIQSEKNVDTPDNAGSPAPRGQLVSDANVPGPRTTRTKPLTYADAQTLQRLAETLSEEDRAVASKILRGR